MPKSLGLIETRGLVAAIVAADTMLKSANVTLAGKELSDAGLVTIKVLGDTASVKAAVEAAVSAVTYVGELISAHVIPRPDNELLSIFPEFGDEETPAPSKKSGAEQIIKEQTVKAPSEKEARPEKPVKAQNAPVEKAVNTAKIKTTVSKRAEPKEKKISKPEKEVSELKIINEPQVSLFDVQDDTIARLRKEALKSIEVEDLAPQESKKIIKEPAENVNTESGQDISNLNLDELDVHELRRLARSTKGFPIHGRQISKANRKELIEYFKNLI